MSSNAVLTFKSSNSGALRERRVPGEKEVLMMPSALRLSQSKVEGLTSGEGEVSAGGTASSARDAFTAGETKFVSVGGTLTLAVDVFLVGGCKCVSAAGAFTTAGDEFTAGECKFVSTRGESVAGRSEARRGRGAVGDFPCWAEDEDS